MSNIKSFVMGYFKKACIGCAAWCDDVDSVMYQVSFAQLETCRDMLIDLGYTYEELMALEAKFVAEYAVSHNREEF